jgi:hypothetical protein
MYSVFTNAFERLPAPASPSGGAVAVDTGGGGALTNTFTPDCAASINSSAELGTTFSNNERTMVTQ